MRVAVIGSRNIPQEATATLASYLPASTSEIVSGGAKGVDQAAKTLAKELGIPLKEFFPDYKTYGKQAPFRRNDLIIDYADMVLALWDGESKGTQYVIGECLKKGKCVVYIPFKGE